MSEKGKGRFTSAWSDHMRTVVLSQANGPSGLVCHGNHTGSLQKNYEKGQPVGCFLVLFFQLQCLAGEGFLKQTHFGTYRALTPPYVFLFSNRRLLIIQSLRDLQCYSTLCRNICLYEFWYVMIIYFSFARFKPTVSPLSRLQQHTCSCWFSHWHSKTSGESFSEIIQYFFM